MKNRFLKLTSLVILGTTIFFGCSKNTVDSKSTTTPVTKITSNTSIQTKINSTSSSTIASSTTKEAENTKTKVSTKENGSASNEEVKDEYSKYSNKKMDGDMQIQQTLVHIMQLTPLEKVMLH